jgi:hypothetical protein
MSHTHPEISYKGRTLGLLAFVTSQLIIGLIHVGFGFLLLASRASELLLLSNNTIYSVYTVLFGLLTFVFTFGLWLSRREAWFGTLAVSFFVIAADSLTLLNLPSIPGIPKAAGVVEISYSIIIVIYLLGSVVWRKKYPIFMENNY